MLSGDRLHSVRATRTNLQQYCSKSPDLPYFTAPGMRKGSTGRSHQSMVANPLFSVM